MANNKEELRSQLNKLIDEVSRTKHSEMLSDFKQFNSHFEPYDGLIVNFIQSVSRNLFTKNIVGKLKKYVTDILDNFESYSPIDKEKVQKFLYDMFIKYGNVEKTFLDKLLSVLRGS